MTNWGNYPIVPATEVSFSMPDQLPGLLTGPCIARGNGRCYGDASLAATVISTRKFDKMLAFDGQTGRCIVNRGCCWPICSQSLCRRGGFCR